MKNFIQGAGSIQLIAPVGGVDGGQLFKQGTLIGIVVSDAAEGEQFTLILQGAFSGVPKTTGQAWAVGDMVYFETVGSTLTTTSTSNTWAGYAYSAALSGDTTGDVLLKM